MIFFARKSNAVVTSFAAVVALLLLSHSAIAGSFNASLAATPNPNIGDYTMTWSNPTSLTYELEEMPVGGSVWTQIASTNGTSFAITGKALGDYLYRLKYSKLQCSGFPDPTCYMITNYSETATVTVGAPPPVPGGLTGPTTDYNGSYTISWNASTGAASYNLQQQLGSGSWSQTYGGSSTSKAISGNAAGTYSYRVQACNSLSQCSSWSATKVVTVQAAPSTPR